MRLWKERAGTLPAIEDDNGDELRPLGAAPPPAASTQTDLSRLNLDFDEALCRLTDSQSPTGRIAAVTQVLRHAAAVRQGATGSLPAPAIARYERAGEVLAVALTWETHAGVRDALVDALKSLLTRAREFGADAHYQFIGSLADANRAAQKNFIASLARYVVYRQSGDFDALHALVGVAGLWEREPLTDELLRSFALTATCRHKVQEITALRWAQNANGDAPAVSVVPLFEVLLDQLVVLKTLRDLLATAVRTLPAAAVAALSHRLPLEHAFLAGADLHGANLEGADLRGAFLHGASLDSAYLAAADLSDAQLAGALLSGVTLLDRDELMGKANLRGADWWEADIDSWRGADNKERRAWLSQHFRQNSKSADPAAPRPVKEAKPRVPRVAPATVAATVAPATPVAAATESLAALLPNKRPRSLAATRRTRYVLGGADTGETPLPPRASVLELAALPDTAPVVSPRNATVTVRESALPNSADTVTDSDLLEITDLLAASRGDGAVPDINLVQRRESPLPKIDAFTDDDLLEITDLLADK